MKYTIIQRGNFLAESDNFDSVIEMARVYSLKNGVAAFIIRNFKFDNEKPENHIPDCWTVSPLGYFAVSFNPFMSTS